MSFTSVTIIVSPYHTGLYDHRVGGGPIRIVSHGLPDKLEQLAPVSFINIKPVDDDFEGEIGRSFEIIRRVSEAVAVSVGRNSFPLVLSGNCNASAGVAAGLSHSTPDLNVLWIDAHDDLDTPSTHENGYLDAMALSMMTGLSWHQLMSSVPGHKPASLDRVLLCGLRDVTPIQEQSVHDAKVEVIWGDATQKVDFPACLGSCLDQRRFGKTLVHLDLDVLDASLGRVNNWSSPGGFQRQDLLSCLRLVPLKTAPISLTVCSFDPRLGDGDTIAALAVQGIVQFLNAMMENGHLRSSGNI